MSGPSAQILAILQPPVIYGPNVNAETRLFGAAIPLGVLNPNTSLRIRAGGLITTVGGAPVLDVRVRIGPVTLTGAIVSSRAEISPVADTTFRVFTSNNQTGQGWVLDLYATLQPNGISLEASGYLATAVNNQFQYGYVFAHGIVTTPVDPAIDNIVEVTAQWDDLAANILQVKTASIDIEAAA